MVIEIEQKYMNQELQKNITSINTHFGVLQDQYGVKRIGIFGSTARGTQMPESDVDMIVEFSRVPGMFRFIELEEYLSELVQKKVDLTTKNALKPSIRERVLQEVVYA